MLAYGCTMVYLKSLTIFVLKKILFGLHPKRVKYLIYFIGTLKATGLWYGFDMETFWLQIIHRKYSYMLQLSLKICFSEYMLTSKCK